MSDAPREFQIDLSYGAEPNDAGIYEAVPVTTNATLGEVYGEAPPRPEVSATYTRADLFARALSAAKEAAAELDALSTAYGEMRGTADILAMVKAEIAELEKVNEAAP